MGSDLSSSIVKSDILAARRVYEHRELFYMVDRYDVVWDAWKELGSPRGPGDVTENEIKSIMGLGYKLDKKDVYK